MIARIRAWLGRHDQLTAEDLEWEAGKRNTRNDFEQVAQVAQVAALQARIAELEQQLSTEQMTTTALDGEVKRLVRQNNVINLRADSAIAEAARVRANAEYLAAKRCECGGDTELHWRRRAAAAEQQAARDRANAVRMADEIERLRLRADEADRLVHIAEQLERAR